MAHARRTGLVENDIIGLSRYITNPDHYSLTSREQRKFLCRFAAACSACVVTLAGGDIDRLTESRAGNYMIGSTPRADRSPLNDLPGAQSIVALLNRVSAGTEPDFDTGSASGNRSMTPAARPQPAPRLLTAVAAL